MAKPFRKLKDPRLGLQDVLTMGKYKGCMVCDVLVDDWEYLKWLDANTSIKFQQPVLDKITAAWTSWCNEVHYQEEVAPYMDNSMWGLGYQDVPF